MRMKIADLAEIEKIKAHEKESKLLSQALERKLHVLLIYRKMIPSIRLCGHCQMEYMARQGTVEYRPIQEMKLKSSDLDWADVALLGRLDSWYECQLSKKLHESGRYLIYIIDDDLLNVPSEISSASYYNQPNVQRNIRTMIELSDAILSPSPILLNKYAVGGKHAVQIEEPAIDLVPYRPHNLDGPVKIGFAGSIDRTGDLETILEDPLKAIKQKYTDKVQFEFFGAIPAFANELDAKCIPYCNSYDEYRSILNKLEWDIGLAPMLDTPFHSCKHYNKFVEYAAAGVIGLYSNVMPYSRLKPLGLDLALLVDPEPDSWFEILCSLIDNQADLERRRRLVIQYAAKKMSIPVAAETLLKQLLKLPIGYSTKKRVFCMISTAKMLAVLDRVCHVIYSRVTKWLIKKHHKSYYAGSENRLDDVT